MVILNEAAAEIGMKIAGLLSRSAGRVDEESVRMVLPDGFRARVEEVEEGLYQVTIEDADGRQALVVILTYNPHWVSPVTYMGHVILDSSLVEELYKRLFSRATAAKQ